jgi:hypothetical protein
MRYEGQNRYGGGDGGHIYALTRPKLTPAQVGQVQVGLQLSPNAQQLYPQLTADQDDFSLNVGTITHLFTSDALRTITGFANVGIGIKSVTNIGSQDVVLANDNAGSLAQNRILTHMGADITLNPGESALIFYDFVTQRVRTIGFT